MPIGTPASPEFTVIYDNSLASGATLRLRQPSFQSCERDPRFFIHSSMNNRTRRYLR